MPPRDARFILHGVTWHRSKWDRSLAVIPTVSPRTSAMLCSLRLSALSTILALGVVPVGAQGPTTSAPAPVVIRAARMLDLTSGQMVREVRVVVAGERIAAVKSASIPAGARGMVWGDVKLMAGLI